MGNLASRTSGSYVAIDNSKTHIEVWFKPLSLSIPAALLGLFILLLFAKTSDGTTPVPGLLRRFAAFYVDFMYVGAGIVRPIQGLVDVLAERWRTGTWQWNFVRDYAARTDTAVFFVSAAAYVLAIMVYFALPLMRGRPTIGSLMLGYQVVADDGNPLTWGEAGLRVFLGFFAACSTIIAFWIGRDASKGKFWLDKVCKTHAVWIQ